MIFEGFCLIIIWGEIDQDRNVLEFFCSVWFCIYCCYFLDLSNKFEFFLSFVMGKGVFIQEFVYRK